MPYISARKRRRSEVAVALAIYGKELSKRDRDIASAYAKGKPVTGIAYEYGLSLPSVYMIVNKLRNMMS